MKFWLNKKSESDNLVLVTENAFLVASCKEKSYDEIEQKLNANVSPLELFGNDDLLSIPFEKIQNVSSLNTDEDLDIKYQTSKELKEQTLYFEELSAKESFIAHLDKALPNNLVKSETQQSAFSASISPFLSLLVASFSSYLFINKFRWLTIIIGGIWVIVSLATLVKRMKSPPIVTRWSLEGRYFKKTWQLIKTFFSYVLLVAVIIGFHTRFPDSHGKYSLSQNIGEKTLTKDEVQEFVERGADINLKDEDGFSPLMKAIDWDEDGTAIALIESGADLNLLDDDGDSYLARAIYNESNISIIESLLEYKASLDIKIEDLTPLEYAVKHELTELQELIKKHQN